MLYFGEISITVAIFGHISIYPSCHYQKNITGLSPRILTPLSTIFHLISWRSVLLEEESRAPGDDHWQTLSHKVVSSTPRLGGIRPRYVSVDEHWWRG